MRTISENVAIGDAFNDDGCCQANTQCRAELGNNNVGTTEKELRPLRPPHRHQHFLPASFTTSLFFKTSFTFATTIGKFLNN